MKKEFTVDYIDFHIPKLSPNKLLEIALYLLDLGFNSKEKKATADVSRVWCSCGRRYGRTIVAAISTECQLTQPLGS